MAFEKGNKRDGKHYWLTPGPLMNQLQSEFNFDFDPCPFPKPENFDGLNVDWGHSNYVNPPFGSYKDSTNGKRLGPTAWVRKAISEFKKGKRVVIVYPIDGWLMELIAAGVIIRNLGVTKWLATEDNTPGRGTGRKTGCFILEPANYVERSDMVANVPYDGSASFRKHFFKRKIYI